MGQIAHQRVAHSQQRYALIGWVGPTSLPLPRAVHRCHRGKHAFHLVLMGELPGMNPVAQNWLPNGTQLPSFCQTQIQVMVFSPPRKPPDSRQRRVSPPLES